MVLLNLFCNLGVIYLLKCNFGHVNNALRNFLNFFTWREKLRVECETTGEQFTITDKRSYYQYLSSDHFINLKKQLRTLQDDKCYVCGKQLTYEKKIGHHTSTEAYKRLGRERAGIDLILVCEYCHNWESHKRLHRFKIPNWAKRSA